MRRHDWAVALVLRDQLTREVASLADIDPARGVVLMVEGLTRPVMFATKKEHFCCRRSVGHTVLRPKIGSEGITAS